MCQVNIVYPIAGCEYKLHNVLVLYVGSSLVVQPNSLYLLERDTMKWDRTLFILFGDALLAFNNFQITWNSPFCFKQIMFRRGHARLIQLSDYWFRVRTDTGSSICYSLFLIHGTRTISFTIKDEIEVDTAFDIWWIKVGTPFLSPSLFVCASDNSFTLLLFLLEKLKQYNARIKYV